MFPFTYNKHISLITPDLNDGDLEIITNALVCQFDDPKKNNDWILFDNFNVSFKRHQWLDDGRLKITYSKNSLAIDLELNFYMFSIILMTVSCFLILFNLKDILFALIGIFSLFLFYFLLYWWTALMFNISIKNTIKRQLYLLDIDKYSATAQVTDRCPACNGLLISEMDKCPKCGISFK